MQGVVNVTRDRCRTVAGFRFKATSGREPRINFPRTVVEDDYYPTKIHYFFYFEKSCVSWKLGLFHSPQVCQICECAVGLVVGTADLQSFNIACPLRTVPGSNISSLQFHSFTAFYGTSRCANTCIYDGLCCIRRVSQMSRRAEMGVNIFVFRIHTIHIAFLDAAHTVVFCCFDFYQQSKSNKPGGCPAFLAFSAASF